MFFFFVGAIACSIYFQPLSRLLQILISFILGILYLITTVSQPTADAAAKAAAEQEKIDARSKRFGNAAPAIAASLAAAKSMQGCPLLICCHIFMKPS